MDRQAKEAREMTKQLKGKEKWKNFWFYYKFHIIALIFVVALVSYTLVECVQQVKYDLSISCYTATLIDDSNLDAFTDEIEKIIDDINENDEIDAGITVNMTDITTPSEQTQAVFMKYSAELAGGESFGYILDETFYSMLTKDSKECIYDAIQIDNIPIIKETFGLSDDQKLYWVTKSVYEREKDKPKSIAAHKNAIKVQEYLSSLIK